MLLENLVYIGTVQMAFTLVAASYFAAADGFAGTALRLKMYPLAFPLFSGPLFYFTFAILLCHLAIFFFFFPMGDTSRFLSANKPRD